MNSEKLITETALQTIYIESQSINNLKSSINTDFVKAVKLIYSTSGRLIVTGIGKSAIIGQKIVATLNSTGTPAIFMHAADAVHGDLGMIQTNDIVLCISKSGETPEIKVLGPILKSRGNQLIALTSQPESYLGKQADVLLHTPIEREADPNNLAPTASTTAQLVMGDALATSLLALRGFSQKDFAHFHPGGSLGKQLYLRVSDIYPSNEKPAIFETTNLRDTILEITSKRLGCTAVVDKGGKLIGIVTDGDLRRALEKNTPSKDFFDLRAKDVMTPAPKVIYEDMLATEALQLMRKHSITQLMVVKEEQYLGIVHLHDLIKEGIMNFE